MSNKKRKKILVADDDPAIRKLLRIRLQENDFEVITAQNGKEAIKKLSQQADRIEGFLVDNEPRIGSAGKEIQSNVTDNESAKMATSHGVQQGDNANTMDRFFLRGAIKVGIQWKLYCLVHNIEKILNYGKTFAMT